MKKQSIRVNALALVLIFGLASISCETGSDPMTGSANLNTGGGVWVFSELPTILSLPLPVAVGYADNPGGGSASLVDLTVPQDSGLYGGPAWTGNGSYYVAVAIDRGPMVYFADGGETPVKVAFNQVHTTLEFGKFKAWSPAE